MLRHIAGIAIAAAAVAAHGQAFYYGATATVTSKTNAVGQNAPLLTVPFAKIKVYTASGSLATLYGDAGQATPLTQPVTADASGRYGFYAASGNYTAIITSAGGSPVSTTPFSVGGSGSGVTLPVNAQVIGTNGTTPVSRTLATVASTGQTTDLSGNIATVNNVAIPPGGTVTISASLPGPVSTTAITAAGGVTEATQSAKDYAIPGKADRFYSPTYTTNGSILGDGHIYPANTYTNDNTLGRNVGFGNNLGNNILLRDSRVESFSPTFATPGITELMSINAMKVAPGDFGGIRAYWNTICSLTAASDEACKFHYDNVLPVTSYSATLASVITSGVEIMTTATDGCGMTTLADNNCSGGQRWLINKTATPTYSGNVTAITQPSNSALGTMTLSGSPNFTPTVYATIAAGLPDTTNALLGDTVQAVISNASGTVPASGPYCVDGPLSAEVDCGTYTANGTTLTLSGHRWPHSNANGAPTIFFTTPRQAVMTVDRTNTNADIGYQVLGFASGNVAYWTAIGGGSRSGGNLQQFQAAYTAAGTNGVTIYDAALVVTTEDPALAGVAPYGAAPSQHSAPSHDGYMRLAQGNVLRLTVGDALSETLPPATNMVLYDSYLNPTQYSPGNTAFSTTINDNVPLAYKVGLANPHSLTTAGTGFHPLPTLFGVNYYINPAVGGAYANFFSAPMAPAHALLVTGNCQGGAQVGASGCPNDHEWAIYTNQSTGEGFFYNLNASSVTGAYVGAYSREAWQYKYWQSPNGPAGLVWDQGFTLGRQGCPLTPNTTNGATSVSLGTGYNNTPCSLGVPGTVTAASLSTGQASAVGTTCTVGGYVTVTIDGTARKLAYCQ